MKYFFILTSILFILIFFSCCKTKKESTIESASPKIYNDAIGSNITSDSMKLIDVETTSAGLSPEEIEPDKIEMVLESPKSNNNNNNNSYPIKVKSHISGGSNNKPTPINGNNNNNNNNNNINVIEKSNSKVINTNTDLTQGRIVYKIPEKMKVRTTYKVLVRIAQSEKTISVYDGLSGDVMASNIPITETMEVKLIDVSPKDNKAFDIEDGNSAVQLIENGDTYTEWSWDVTPIRVGNSNLKIVVSVIRNDKKKDIVYEDTVEVEKDILVQVLFFLKKYWQVLMTSIAIPFIVFLYKRRKDKKEKEKEIDAKKGNENA